jgi:hypothetical protein
MPRGEEGNAARRKTTPSRPAPPDAPTTPSKEASPRRCPSRPAVSEMRARVSVRGAPAPDDEQASSVTPHPLLQFAQGGSAQEGAALRRVVCPDSQPPMDLTVRAPTDR